MIICVVGPTAVGKTRLSEEIAKKYNAIVVNADAMQVYKELDIGTAKVKNSEKCDKSHYLFDIASPKDNYTVYDYQKDLRQIISEHNDENICIVGGTGLYLKAGLYNYEFEEREETNEYVDFSNEELYGLLKEKGMLDNEIHPNNRKRMVSRLNSSGNHNLKDELLYKDVLFIGLTTDREILYKKIDDRVDKMVEEGLLEEVQTVYAKYGSTKALNTGIGYKEIISYLNGEISLDGALDLVKQKSRKYAKRQFTWFNNQMDITWFQTDYENFDNTVKEVFKYIDSKMNN